MSKDVIKTRIYQRPEPISLYSDNDLNEPLEEDKEIFEEEYKIANDETDIMDYGTFKKENLYWGGFLAFNLVICSRATPEEMTEMYIYFFGLLSVSLFLFYHAFKEHPDYQKFIMYRLTGKIRFRGNTGFMKTAKPRPLVDFKDCVFKHMYFNGGGMVTKRTFLMSTVGGEQIHMDPHERISFITWYMDKNRPLPPGTYYDRFREKDFERRKKEGFPKPLYPSDVPTPEHTPEQQAERERIGGW